MIILRIVLLPVSILYGLIIQLRNLLYNLNIFTIQKFNKHIISIGNIIAGGTGKTPFTIYLANLLIEQGKKVAVVSRGYGRKSKGFFLISDGNESKGNTLTHGDEPVLISLLVPKAIVAVCENRSKAIKQLNSQYDIDVFILDDGFQHRVVYRDIDIVILKDQKLLRNNLLMPSGFLREFRFNLKRADVLINRDGDSVQQDHFSCSMQIDSLYNTSLKEQGSISDIINKKCVAFAGIAHPENFEKSLQVNQISINEFISYKDHYFYDKTDIQFLVNKCFEYGCNYLLCTQKDLVKIREIEGLKNILQTNDINLLATGLKVILNNDQSFLKKIESHLD